MTSADLLQRKAVIVDRMAQINYDRGRFEIWINDVWNSGASQKAKEAAVQDLNDRGYRALNTEADTLQVELNNINATLIGVIKAEESVKKNVQQIEAVTLTPSEVGTLNAVLNGESQITPESAGNISAAFAQLGHATESKRANSLTIEVPSPTIPVKTGLAAFFSIYKLDSQGRTLCDPVSLKPVLNTTKVVLFGAFGAVGLYYIYKRFFKKGRF